MRLLVVKIANGAIGRKVSIEALSMIAFSKLQIPWVALINFKNVIGPLSVMNCTHLSGTPVSAYNLYPNTWLVAYFQ